ncbi:MAG: hypothetical protein QM679_12945, partial [Patulibacter sp.]
MRFFVRPARRAAVRPLSEALAPPQPDAARGRSLPHLLVVVAAGLLALALLAPRDAPPVVPGDELRPVAVAATTPAIDDHASTQTPTRSPVAQQPAQAGASAASVIPGDDPAATSTPQPHAGRHAAAGKRRRS